MRRLVLALISIAFAANAQLASTKLAFHSDRSGRHQIYTIEPDGMQLARLTYSDVDEGGEIWSPDGRTIAFVSSRDGQSDVYVMNWDGSAQVRLTTGSRVTGLGSFSPDGSRITFVSDRDGNNELYVMNSNGTSPIRLTSHPSDDQSPLVSPDGTRIAFMSTRTAGEFEIFVSDADGSNPVQLTSGQGRCVPVSWSPDGSKIAYHAGFPGSFQVWIMNADGSGRTQLTFAGNDNSEPTWSPDGLRIGFLSSRDHAWIYNIWVMNADGSNQHPINSDYAQHYGLRWSPVIQSARSGRIDIKPDTAENSLNCRQLQTNIPVAILGGNGVDVSQIVESSVQFGPGGATERHGRLHYEDVNGDSVLDAVGHFMLGETHLTCSDTSATLVWTTTTNESFSGTDEISMAGR